MAIADLTVLGGGIFGLSVAWEATRRGARVRLIETRRIGAGSSGGIVGALAPHTPEQWNPKKQMQFDALVAAGDWWREIAARGGVDPGYARLGRLQAVADDAARSLAEARATGAAEHWQGQAEWRLVPDRDFGGWAPSSPTGLLIFDSLTARLHPRRAGQALAAALRAAGAEVIEGRTADLQGAVVEATGWEGLAALTGPSGAAAGAGIKGQAALLDHDARDLPQLFLDGVHIVPHADGTTAIGSTSERDFASPGETDAQLDTLIATARRLCPALDGARVIERWAGVRPRARSRAPLLGPRPGVPGHFIANGGFKIGFAMAQPVARMLVDLVLEGWDAIPPAFDTRHVLR